MDLAYWSGKLTQAKALADAIEAAILALTTGGVQSYELDTGQSKQRVTKLDLDRLNAMYDSALNRVATLEARVHGSGVVIAGAAW